MQQPRSSSSIAIAFALCQHAGDTAQHFSVLFGLRSCHLARGDVHKAHELGAQLLHTAELAEDQDLKCDRGPRVPPHASFWQLSMDGLQKGMPPRI